jgi:hypothetical protein
MQEQEYREAASNGVQATQIVPLTQEQLQALGQGPTQFAGTGLPAGFNGSAIVRDPVGGRLGLYPTKVLGAFALTSGSLAAGNNINLCYIPANSFLSDFNIVTSALTGTLQDNLATPTVYCTLSGAITTTSNITAGQGQAFGTMYASTPRAVGANGCAVVQWRPGTLLQVVLTGTPTYTTPVVYMLEFSPAYDGGV